MAENEVLSQAFWNNIANQVEMQIRQKVEAAKEKAFRRYLPVVKDSLQKMYDEAVQEFRSDGTGYEATVYVSRGTLEKLLKLEIDDGGLSMDIDYDTEGVPYRSGTGTGLFEQVFIKGWHGGAAEHNDGFHPNPGTPYWRAPARGSHKFRYWYRSDSGAGDYQEAVQTKSAYDIFNEKVDEYEKEEFTQLFSEYLNDELSRGGLW